MDQFYAHYSLLILQVQRYLKTYYKPIIICNVSALMFKILYTDGTCVLAQGHNINLIDTFGWVPSNEDTSLLQKQINHATFISY